MDVQAESVLGVMGTRFDLVIAQVLKLTCR